MKGLSKPLSSPSRADKFPPPLMRFLRSNAGSRSRGRSRSSPMFYLRSRKSVPGVNETTQEPSSPKVTCVGQVRAQRSTKSKAKKPRRVAVKRRRCGWLRKALFCGKIFPRFGSRRCPFRSLFCKRGLLFGFCCCKNVDDAEDSFGICSNQKGKRSENHVAGSSDSESGFSRNKYESLGTVALETKRGFPESASSSSPPKNALFLTRCRSAPYRSSSLGGRFWGSPLAEGRRDYEAENEGKSEVLQNPNGMEEPRMSQESNKESDESLKIVQESKALAGGAVHPLLLTRCKSEPARTGERLNPAANFLGQTRLDAVESLLHVQLSS